VTGEVFVERDLDGVARPITVRVREACRLTGIGRSKLYMLIEEGHIEVVKVGSMTLIPMRSLENSWAWRSGEGEGEPARSTEVSSLHQPTKIAIASVRRKW